jgi:5-methylcytosine-specific restriction endonuclease McrA
VPINYKQYHPKWTLIRRLILKRAANKCEGSPKFPNCQAHNHQPHPVTKSKVVLTIAHLDRNKDNNQFTNLKALCQRCHLMHDIKQHTANRKYGRNHKSNHQTKLIL